MPVVPEKTFQYFCRELALPVIAVWVFCMAHFCIATNRSNLPAWNQIKNAKDILCSCIAKFLDNKTSPSPHTIKGKSYSHKQEEQTTKEHGRMKEQCIGKSDERIE